MDPKTAPSQPTVAWPRFPEEVWDAPEDTETVPAGPGEFPRTAIGAAESCPVVLVEAIGALGVLFAQRRCPGETLEKVIYFRLVPGKAYARYLEQVELLTIDDYVVAAAAGQLLYQPSAIPYAIKNISWAVYRKCIDRIVPRDAWWMETCLAGFFRCSGI